MSACTLATDDGTYPFVWGNELVDPSFGITSGVLLDEVTTRGWLVDSLGVPGEQLVTSFPSKSELALNLSTNGRHTTFIGYVAPERALDVSNTNTPDANRRVINSATRAAERGRYFGL